MDEYGSRIVATRRSQPKRAGSSKTVGRTRDKKFSEESQGEPGRTELSRLCFLIKVWEGWTNLML